MTLKRDAYGENAPVTNISFTENKGFFAACMGGFTAKNQIRTSVKQASSAQSEAMLVDEWNKLSFQERERIQEEVHGVAGSEVEETPEFLDELLKLMNEEVAKIRSRSAYDKALFLCPSYVKDRDFRLKFLRAESYQAREAANRIVRFFQCKLDLFGIDCLAKTLTLDDLDPEDMEYYLNGPIQLLPQKDRSGRAVIIEIGRCQAMRTIKMAFYLIMQAVEDVEVQKKGVVLVHYDFSYDRKEESEFMMKGLKSTNALPWRLASVHYCDYHKKNAAVMAFMAFVQFAVGKPGRLRFRSHQGSPIECHYALMTFGIPFKDFPVDDNGDKVLGPFHRQVNIRRALEAERRKRFGDAIYFPTSADILCGRGKPFQEFPGNLRLAEIIESKRDLYRSLKRGSKMDVCKDIVRAVRTWKGRFLKRNDGSDLWVEVKDEEAREKVSQGFRNMFKKFNTNNNASTAQTTSSASEEEDPTIVSDNSNTKRQRPDAMDMVSEDDFEYFT